MWALKYMLFCHMSLLTSVLAESSEVNELSGVRYLTGESDFRDVTLRWESDQQVPNVQGFHIHYCELQAWGAHRCRTKTMDDSSGNEILSATQSKARMYSVIISGLRMSTNYSFEIRPMGEEGRASSDFKLGSRTIIVPTKGFSARATQCLPDASEVEVATGPHFGGRITVEAADGERCAVDGDPDSPTDTYTLRINHTVCGSHVNETTVATFVIVQENLPILTHSTRRFLVLCTFQPETLTVRAGINLPGGNSRNSPDSSNRLEYVHPEIYPLMDGIEQSESVNDVQVARLQHHRQMVETTNEEIVNDNSIPHVVLMVILVAVGVVGSVVAAWWFAPTIRKRNNDESTLHPDDSSSISMYDNFENALRDSSSVNEINFDDFTFDNDSAIYSPSQCPTVNEGEREGPGVFTIRVRNDTDLPCIRMDSYSQSEA